MTDIECIDEWYGVWPGSDEAVTLGCACPRESNHYGAGLIRDYNGYEIKIGCPVHGGGNGRNQSTQIVKEAA